ncbi:MAG: GAF domain-containing protein [Chitinophagaceae bacterium]
MKKGVIQLNQFATRENSVETLVSFKKFADFLEEKMNAEKTKRAYFFKYVLDKINGFPELLSGIPVADVPKYDEVLDLVASISFPLMEDENEVMFGLSGGISPQLFYVSNALGKLIDSRPDIHALNGVTGTAKENALQMHQQVQYDLILQKVYGFELPQKKEVLRTVFNPQTGLYQYYRLNIDTRFVDIKSRTKIDTSLINDHSINECFQCGNSFDEMEKLVPLNNFIASGFSIVTLTDITEQQAIEQLSKTIRSVDKKENAADSFEHLTRLLQTTIGSSYYKFGLMPFFTVNNRAALLYENFPYSLLAKASWDAGIPKPVFTRYINHYLKNPGFITYQSSDKTNVLPKPLQDALKKAGFHYYVLTPVYFNGVLVGILETGAAEGAAPLTELHFGKLKPAIPYISQLLKLMTDKFNIAIDTIVKDKFTVIQPAVQWKFNEVAWHYFRSHDIEHKNNALEKISFKNVHPLYGAVDIRNSTIERNKALREDLHTQLILLIDVLDELKSNGIENADALADHCHEWLAKMTDYVSVEEELQLNEFLYTQVNPLLGNYNNEENKNPKISNYFAAIDETNGIAFNKRRQLENSIRLLNKSISKYFDAFKDELQNYYPCYFEKFRTDGTEYDIYIGQSIAPKIPFTQQDLEKLRRWQVSSMAAIAKLTNSMLPQLETPMQTTQLIFVNARAIDISFRNDERRFDVEGAYNIRYHIIKKRIDKVNILNTNERLTQPGKIAIVYFNERDAEEYIGYIKELQEQNVLENDLEHLELEFLQGVAGLKALRVSVKLSEL